MTEAAPLLMTEWTARLKTRSGVELDVRPASTDDEALLVDFYQKLTPEDLRFRFLSTVKNVGPTLVHPLADVDHRQTEDFLAFDTSDGSLVGTAVIAAAPDLQRAEVAIAVRSDRKGEGIGWSLLDHAADFAAARGIRRIESIESSQNAPALLLEREMGFSAEPYEDSTLTLVSLDLDRRR